MKCVDTAKLDFWIINAEELLNLGGRHPDEVNSDENNWVLDAVYKGQFYSEMPHGDQGWKFFVEDTLSSCGREGDFLVKHPGGYLRIYQPFEFFSRFQTVKE